MARGRIWIVDDDNAIRWVLEKTLTSADIYCETFIDGEEVLQALEHDRPDVIMSDIRMPNMDGLTLLSHIQSIHPNLPVIIMTAHSDLDAAVNAYQTGAYEYLPKPFDIDEALTLVERALAHAEEQKKKSKNSPVESNTTPEILGESPAMQEVFRAIGRLSHSSISVLINGESGTGKELVAHALHRHSPRKEQSFIALNMAAIPKDLIESELFGHEKGAFTGANSVRKGRFEQANGGTLFLDEIGDMPLEIQTRLLRVLADGQFYRVGGHSPVQVDVRIIAATHQNLEQAVANGTFREDLFHRLNVIRIQIPALRNRRDDIEILAKHFLNQAAKELSVEVKTLHSSTIAILRNLPWSGNVRQLENVCRWITVMASGREVHPQDLPPELLQSQPHVSATNSSSTADSLAPKTSSIKTTSINEQSVDSQLGSENLSPTQYQSANLDASLSWTQALELWAVQALNNGESEIHTKALAEFERVLLNAALEHTKGKKQQAAQRLGWGRNTITRKLKELYT